MREWTVGSGSTKRGSPRVSFEVLESKTESPDNFMLEYLTFYRQYEETFLPLYIRNLDRIV